MKIQQQLAAAIAAPGALAALGMTLIGIYPYVDCARFQTAAGQCTEQLKTGVNLSIAALSTLLASRLSYEQGYGTFNPALRSPDGGLAPGRLPAMDKPEIETWTAEELQLITVAELRQLARSLGNNALALKGKKADLVAFVSGTPKHLTNLPNV